MEFVMINTIEREDIGNELFDNFIDDFNEYSYQKHRRGSNFYVRAIVEINEQHFPKYPEYWGLWETNDFIRDDEWGWERDEIYKLTRAEKQTIMVPTDVWVEVK